MEKEQIDIQKMVDTYKTNVKEIDQDMKETKTTGEEQKYEILYQKEKEINEFQEKFEVDKVQYEREINDNQYIISQLLEHMQKTMAR